MRTSRDDEASRNFLWQELGQNRLRQGWGYEDRLDLRKLLKKKQEEIPFDDAERDAWKNWRMLGEESGFRDDSILLGDYILVPNMPRNGHFTICKVSGPYEYDDTEIGDYRHYLPVEVLAQDIANEHELADAGLRRSLRCRSRLWWIGGYVDSITQLLDAAKAGERLSEGAGHLDRAKGTIADVIDHHIDELSEMLSSKLPRSLGAAEWEPVIGAAFEPGRAHPEGICNPVTRGPKPEQN